jgi:HAE1 family hydrophobic/amphiphilic exporter-1
MQALARLCVRRPVFATMLILALVVVGGFSYFTLGVDLLPKVDLPVVTITVFDPGASPEEIETEISKKIEDAVNTISDIDELRSNSSEGQSQTIIQFDLSKDGNVAAQEVQNNVNQIVNLLPQSAKTPVVQKLDTDAAPVMQIAVSAPRSLRDLTLIADKLVRQKLETATGVGQIRLVGGARREIHVDVDPDRLRSHGLTITDVTNSVRQQNLEIPGGALNSGTKEFTVRTMGRITDARQFNDIAVGTQAGYVVKVSDIGNADDSYEEPRTTGRLNGSPAVTVVVSKQSGANSVATANDLKERLKEITATLPKDVRVQLISDQSVFIEAAIDSIKHHLILGSVFACVVIFLFLANWRTTLIAAVAIPTSIISTFALMKALNFTLNQLTMLALTLMVGIVIDDAIIVLENIYRYIEEKGMTPYEAAIEGTREIGLAVMATTLSLLAVFLPVGFMGGIVGRFMSSFGFTSAFAIAVSLLVSFTLTPMLCSRFIKVPNVTERHAHSSKDSKFFAWINRHYLRMLIWAMAHRKTVLGICAVVVLSLIPLMMIVGKDFTPTDDQSQYNVLMRTPEGTSLAATTQEAEAVAQRIRQLPGVADTLTTAGGGQDGAVNAATIFVRLVDVSLRKDSQTDLMQQTRKLLTNFPDNLHTSVEPLAIVGGGGSNAPVQFFIQGPDLDKLAQYSDELLTRMKKIPGVTDADSTLRSGKPEVRLIIDRARAADLGVSVDSIESALNTLVAGQTVSTFNAGDDQFDVRVRAGEQFRTRAEELGRITVPSSRQLAPIPLDTLVSVQSSTGPSSINRIDRQRQVTLSSNVLPGASQSPIMSALKKQADEMHMDPGYTSGFAGSSKQLAQAAYYFLLAIALTFVFMYIVLAAQFESFIHPVTILMTLPLAVPFGILSLVVTGQSMNIDSALGILLLFGIVKKNAILQIDHTNGLRAGGMSRYDAILQANQDRLRPILMTTLALIAGMLPLVISSGAGSGTNRSIGVLVVGGQSMCLLLTLLAVPVFYSLFEDLSEHRIWNKPAGLMRAVASRLPNIKRPSATPAQEPIA